MRRLLPLVLLLLLLACNRQVTEDPQTGQLRGLLVQIPGGERVFIENSLKHLARAGVRPVQLPSNLIGSSQGPAGGAATAIVRLPHPPAVYASEVNYFLLRSQAIGSALGCASALWNPVGRTVGPQAHEYTLWERRRDLKISRGDKVKPSPLVTIPGGEAWLYDEEAQGLRRVRFDSFAMEKTEVTYEQFAAFLNETKHSENVLAQFTDLSRPDNPIVRKDDTYGVPAECAAFPMAFVSYAGAQAYCEHIDRALPPDRFWEIAARGATKRPYPWGEDADVSRYANVSGSEDGYINSSPVGSFPRGATKHGLLDMAGNVFEWTSHDRGVRLRGGAWATDARWVLNDANETNVPHARNNHNGFRCFVLSPPSED
ncbi:MAG: SUMF1/EgtB/PvdO family nonheme iron enzyme [Candidatus Lernaella stagnicola]|nr:SUMF1/EgtB/PvdO family nonheme iron enzyme [Candidatus Lernaella stagnicola]